MLISGLVVTLAGDGREYNFRSVNKDQTGGLHPDFQDTFIDWLAQDQVWRSIRETNAAGRVLVAAGDSRNRGLFRDHPGRIEFQLRVTGTDQPQATILEVADGNNLPRNVSAYELRY